MNRRVFLARTGLVTVPFLLGATTRVAVPKVAARPEDVGSVDGIIKAFYDVISGPAGRPREWGRDRSLYIAGVRFVSVDKKGEKVKARVVDHQQYVDLTDPGFTKKGFFEKEVHRVERGWGQLLQVMSTYESRVRQDGPVTMRGINAIQLAQYGGRWWITNAIWQDESAEVPIAKEWLPA
jgi:hypothetical protein